MPKYTNRSKLTTCVLSVATGVTDENRRAKYIAGLIITRPLKLDGPDVLKTISAVAHKGQIRHDRIMQALYASRDGYAFQPVASAAGSFIRRLHGTPYKSFRIVVIPTFSKQDSIAKTIIDFTPKYTGKVR